MRILVVEDDPMVAMLIEDVLGESGHEVLGPVGSAAAGLALAISEEPDLLLADIGLTDGEIGCKLLDDVEQCCGIRGLFVTGSPDKARLCRSSAIGVLQKPFHPDSLQAAIRIAELVIAGKKPIYIPSELELFPRH